MNTIMVDYDLISPGQKYEAISQYVKQHSWAKVLKSTWLIRTTKSASRVRDDVLGLIDANDKLLVTNVTGDAMAWYGLPKDVSDWILSENRVPAFAR
jgi:hypothetical protein